MRWLLTALLLLLLVPATSSAQEPNRAGLVIQYGDGRIETACVSFAEPDISGFELLRRSGLPFTYDAQAGTLVCSIGGEGCAFPVDGCLCRCSGVGSCVYWSYHQLDEGGTWRYSQLGAAMTRVRPGEVDGWRWGAGEASDAPPPVGVSFESICAAPALPAPTATTVPPTLVPTATRLALPQATATTVEPSPEPSLPAATSTAQATATALTATRTPTVPAVATETAIATATPGLETTATPAVLGTPLEEEAERVSLAPYLLFVLLVLVLGGGVLWARRR